MKQPLTKERPRCTIRIAGTGDLDEVLAVHGSRPPGPASAQEKAAWARMQHTPDLAVYAAEVDGVMVATATALQMPNITYDCRPTLFVEAVVVVPNLRRQGIATVLMERVLADARAAGCHKVQLLSHKRHATDGAHSLYLGLGFTAEAEGFRLYL